MSGREPLIMEKSASKRRRQERQNDSGNTTCESHQPVTLKDTCVRYVSRNIVQVESLVGFPDLVGREIFSAVCDSGTLDDPTSEVTRSMLALFQESYEDLLLSDLDLSTFPRSLLEVSLGAVTSFSSLGSLDLSHLQLGDSHMLWTWLGTLDRLTMVSLQDNCLTDRGVQHLTMSSRMYKRGPARLQSLNLACNPALTDACVRYILTFRKLTSLDLSGTKITAAGVKRLEDGRGLRQSLRAEGGDAVTVGPVCCHRGWAADVLTHWVQNHLAAQTDTDSQPSGPQSVLIAKNFYKKSRMSSCVAKCDWCTEPCPPRKPVIILHAAEQSEQATDSSAGNKSTTEPRPLDIDIGKGDSLNLPSSGLTDILNLYTVSSDTGQQGRSPDTGQQGRSPDTGQHGRVKRSVAMEQNSSHTGLRVGTLGKHSDSRRSKQRNTTSRLIRGCSDGYRRTPKLEKLSDSDVTGRDHSKNAHGKSALLSAMNSGGW